MPIRASRLRRQISNCQLYLSCAAAFMICRRKPTPQLSLFQCTMHNYRIALSGDIMPIRASRLRRQISNCQLYLSCAAAFMICRRKPTPQLCIVHCALCIVHCILLCRLFLFLLFLYLFGFLFKLFLLFLLCGLFLCLSLFDRRHVFVRYRLYLAAHNHLALV